MDLKDYVKVDDLILRMNKDYPKGRLITELVTQIGDLVVFKATFYDGDSEAICTGHGAEKIVRDKKLEKAESVARGRCLRVLFSEKPTFEEMEDIATTSTNTAKKGYKEPNMTKSEPKVDIKEQMADLGISANDVSGLLDASTTLQLTPTRRNIPSGKECDEYTKRDIIPFALEEETVQKVLKEHWKKLISSKYIKGDKLLLPREIVEQTLV